MVVTLKLFNVKHWPFPSVLLSCVNIYLSQSKFSTVLQSLCEKLFLLRVMVTSELAGTTTTNNPASRLSHLLAH